MSADNGTTQPFAPAAVRRGFPQGSRSPKLSLRIIPQIDHDPRIVAYVQRLPGRVLLFAGFIALLDLLGGNLFVAPLAAASAYAGRYRWHAILLGTLLLLYQNGFWVD